MNFYFWSRRYNIIWQWQADTSPTRNSCQWFRRIPKQLKRRASPKSEPVARKNTFRKKRYLIIWHWFEHVWDSLWSHPESDPSCQTKVTGRGGGFDDSNYSIQITFPNWGTLRGTRLLVQRQRTAVTLPGHPVERDAIVHKSREYRGYWE